MDAKNTIVVFQGKNIRQNWYNDDNPSIGMILCKSNNKVVAEYALKDMSKPIGVSEYKIVHAIPEKLKTSLPTIDELEKELSKTVKKTQ